MGTFFAELKRRHIYRVAAAYAVVAWLLIQLVNNLAPMLRLPEWAGSFFFVALLVGFPIALIFAWIHDLAPGEGALGHVTTGKLDWALIGALTVVMLLMSYQVFAPSQATVAADQGVDQARKAAASPTTGISLAVLPFTNLSSDPEQQFFSDGMTEEITSALTKIPDLRVVGRTSAFEFKGQNRNLRDIGQALSATHLLEGSVRREGDRVRITAQLVEAERGVNVWTESYDRQLASVFATQEDIATAIAGALRMPLGLRPGEQLVSSRNIDQESYIQYLRAKALVRARIGGGGLRALNDAIALLDKVVARSEGYAPAWALAAAAYRNIPNYSGILANPGASLEQRRQHVQSSLSKAEPAARRAIQLDPNLAFGYTTLANMQGPGQLLEEEELWSKALSLDPNDPDGLVGYSNFLMTVGRVREALAVAQQVQEVEPFVPLFNRDMALALWLNGQDDAAIETMRKLGTNFAPFAMMLAGAGRYDEAAEILLLIPGAPTDVIQEATRLLRMAPAAVPSASNVKRLGALDFVYLHVGAPEQALFQYEINLDAGWTNVANRFLSHPSFGPARKSERYKAYARKAGLVEYWRAKGWPEFCHPTTGDDFECS
jgi:TolB-like protein